MGLRLLKELRRGILSCLLCPLLVRNGISFFDYVRDRLKGTGAIPSLATLIRIGSAHNPFGWSWQPESWFTPPDWVAPLTGLIFRADCIYMCNIYICNYESQTMVYPEILSRYKRRHRKIIMTSDRYQRLLKKIGSPCKLIGLNLWSIPQYICKVIYYAVWFM